jgi:hypothetical protein
MSKGVWQRFDSDGEVSALVMKAYTVSLLLTAVVLVWTLGDDLRTHYGHSFMDAAYNSNFTSVVDFSLNI